MNDTAEDLSAGLAEQAELIQWHVGVWHDMGYPEPLPSPGCHPIPPLGERPAGAIEGGHAAIRDIDKMIGQLHALRGQLVGELRQDEDIRAARIDALLAERRTGTATTASPVELFDVDHEPVVAWRPAGAL